MEISKLLRDSGFRFNKQFGQNFILDTNLLSAIAQDAGITSDDTVIEIGTGAGTLTRALASVAKRVITFEIDNNLVDIHRVTLQDLNNVEVKYQDFMKVDLAELSKSIAGHYKVVANIPYYITTPIIMRFLEEDYDNVDSLTVMVQKEYADRLCSKPRHADYGAITVNVAIRCDTSITRNVARRMFYPIPNVDSAVIRLDINREKCKGLDYIACSKFVKNCFTMRRKTLINNIINCSPFTREQCEIILTGMSIPIDARSETLSAEQFASLYDIIAKGNN